MDDYTTRQPSQQSGLAPAIGGSLAALWFLVLCFVPDPRPLGAPDAAIQLAKNLLSVDESLARAAAAFTLRAIGLGLLGFLIALSFGQFSMARAAMTAIPSAIALAIVAAWINYGYFPIWLQLQFIVCFSVLGAAAGLAVRSSVAAKVAFVVLCGAVFLLAIPRGISDDLDRSARITGNHVLASLGEISDGDEAFEQTLAEAFRYAESNSEVSDPVHANKSAILALGVILGDDRVAQVAGRKLDSAHQARIKRLRQKVKLRGRSDLARHFWVSAALTVLSDGDRSTAVGVTKELMDSNPGGSGFSFVDLTADRAGVLFAQAATRNQSSALQVQAALRVGMKSSDFCPPIEGLPEGIPRDEFQSDYGGLGGELTLGIVDDIEQRLFRCPGLWIESLELISIIPPPEEP